MVRFPYGTENFMIPLSDRKMFRHKWSCPDQRQLPCQR